MSIQYIVGDVFEVMKTFEDDSVDLILTSPPFLALRSYLPADHPDKGKEIGSEATPAEYIDVLLRLTAEWRRLLAPHGSLVVELGDTYSGSGGAGGDYNENGLREGQQAFSGSAAKRAAHEIGDDYRPSRAGRSMDWPLAKSLTLTPESYRWALVYGFNPFRGPDHPSPAGQWRVRNVIRWVRPNPPVGALGDKFRPATSELVVACTSKDRFFDLDAVRERLPHHELKPYRTGPESAYKPDEVFSGDDRRTGGVHPSGAPPLDWWKISPKGYSGAHYAVWPSELCVKPIKAMCPVKVCQTCGEPSRRITEVAYDANAESAWGTAWNDKPPTTALRPMQQAAEPAASADYGKQQRQENAQGMAHGRAAKLVETVGWSDCGHDDFRPGLVLDPFAGTGTTLAVAHGHGRDAIGIDIDERSAELARDRVGPLFLEIV